MARDGSHRRDRSLAVTLTLLLAVGAFALPALAGPADSGPKTFTSAIDPADGVCVETVETFTLSLRNTSAQQRLGSADVTPAFAVEADRPASVTVDGVARGTATVDHGTIELRDLAAAPGATVELVFDGSSDTAGAHVVEVVAKQANDFRGPPGNDLELIGGPATVTFSASGTCTPPELFDALCDEGQRCEYATDPVDGLLAAASGTAGAGWGGLGLDTAPRSSDACGSYDGDDFARIPATVDALGVNLLDKVVVLTVSKEVDQASVNNGASFYQICATPQEPFSAFSTFVDIFGNRVVSPDDADTLASLPPGDYAASGFLPDCGATGDVPPCVVSRTKTGAGAVVIVVRWGSGFAFG